MAHQPLTSSPIKPVTVEAPEGVWCGDTNNNNNNNSNISSSKVRSMRQTVEQQLQHLALTGDTDSLLKLLEDGAPFVVDMVSRNTLVILHRQAMFDKDSTILMTLYYSLSKSEDDIKSHGLVKHRFAYRSYDQD